MAAIDELLESIYQRMSEHPEESLASAVDAVMAEESKAITPEEALLKEAEALQRQAAAEARLAEIFRAIANRGGNAALPPAAIFTGESSALEVPIARLGIEDAVKYALRSKHDPQKTSQIYKVLLAADYQFIGDDPMHAIQGALKRMSMKANPEAVYVGGGKWTLASLHTPAKLKKLKEKLSGTGGVSAKEHGKRTKDAMIAKGARFGRRPKYGVDDIKKFRHLVEVEKMRPLEALKLVGFSTAYYYQYKDDIYAWKDGEPWPPANKRFWIQTGSARKVRAASVIPFKVVGDDRAS